MIPERGRADLVRALGASGEAFVDRAAALFGFELDPEPAPPSSRHAPRSTGDRAAGGGEATLAARSAEGATGSLERALVTTAPAAFFRVEGVTYAEPDEVALVSHEPGPWEAQSPGPPNVRAPEPAPLVPWPALWRRLRPMLSREVVSDELDPEAAVEALSGAEPMVRLPR